MGPWLWRQIFIRAPRRRLATPRSFVRRLRTRASCVWVAGRIEGAICGGIVSLGNGPRRVSPYIVD